LSGSARPALPAPNQLQTIVVEVPSKLNKEQKRLLEELDSNVDIKQCSKMKQFRDHMQAMYGKDPYN